MQSKLRTDPKKIIKLKEVLNVKCRSSAAFKNDIQMFFCFFLYNNSISIENVLSLSVHFIM